MVKFTDLETRDHKEKVKNWFNNAEIKGASLEDLNWISKNHKKIAEFISEKPSDNTRKGHYSVLGTVMKDYLGSQEDNYQPYIDKSKRLQKKYEDNQENQKLTKKQVKNYVEWDDIINKRKELKEEFEKDVDNRKTMFKYLFISLQTYIPPLRRQEYLNMKIVNKIPTNKDNNYLYYDSLDNKYTVIINKDKVSKKMGSATLPIDSTTLTKLIKRTLTIFPRKYLISGLSDGDKPINKDVFTELLNEMFKKEKKKVAIGNYRSAYITKAWSNPKFSLKQKKELAKRMRHSIGIAELAYKKIYDTFDDKDDADEEEEDSDEEEIPEKKEKKKYIKRNMLRIFVLILKIITIIIEKEY
jgi:hypothetical protein